MKALLLFSGVLVVTSGCSVLGLGLHEIDQDEAARIAVAYMQRNGATWHAAHVTKAHEGGKDYWEVNVVAGPAPAPGVVIVETAGLNSLFVDVDFHSGRVLTRHTQVYL